MSEESSERPCIEDRYQQILAAWRRIMTVLAERTIALQKILIYNRRRSLLRIRRRKALLRLQYFHRMIDIQNQFLLQIPRPVRKRFWREVRNSGFWDDRGVDGFSAKEWLETFRMSKKTFHWICSKVKDDLSPRCSSIRNPVPLEKRVAMSIYKLSTGAEYRIISELFGVARSTVCKFVRVFCESITENISESVIKTPSVQEAISISKGFESISNLPLIIGSVGITHIPVNPPLDGMETFINSSGWTSIVLQGMVDNNFRFRKIDINSRDPSLFTESTENLPKIERTIDNNRVSSYLTGSKCYPLQEWFMKPYSDPSNNDEEYFNIAIENANSITEESFRRLFSRWRVLSKKVDIEYRNMAVVISACCILHNVIEINNDGYDHTWPAQLNPTYEDLQPKEETNMFATESNEGIEFREFLKQYLSKNFN